MIVSMLEGRPAIVGGRLCPITGGCVVSGGHAERGWGARPRGRRRPSVRRGPRRGTSRRRLRPQGAAPRGRELQRGALTDPRREEPLVHLPGEYPQLADVARRLDRGTWRAHAV